MTSLPILGILFSDPRTNLFYWLGVAFIVVFFLLYFYYHDRWFGDIFFFLGLFLGGGSMFYVMARLAGGFVSFLGIILTIVGIISGIFVIFVNWEKLKLLERDSHDDAKRRKKRRK